MPLYWGDYIKDTGSLSLCEHGAYMLLIKEYWVSNANVYANASRLHRICGAMSQDEKDAVDFVVDRFFQNCDGKLQHKRLDAELQKAKEKQEKARISAQKRWAKKDANAHTTANAKGNATAMRTQMRSDNHPQCYSHSHSNILDANASNNINTQFETFWAKYDMKKDRKSAFKAFQGAIKKVDIDTLLKAVDGYNEYCAKTNIPKKYAQGWLNGERWLDDNTVKPKTEATNGKHGKFEQQDYNSGAERFGFNVNPVSE